MKKLIIVAGAVTLALSGVAVGVTATSWASGNGAPRFGPSAASLTPPGGPHALATHLVPDPQSTFQPITPCRIVNSTVAGGILGDGTTRTYYVGGTLGFAPQGGKSGGCGIPVGATAITATVTAATPLQHGFLRMWPAGGTEPNATVLSYPQGVAGNTGATIGIATNTAHALTVRNHGGPAHLIIDVTGFYRNQMEALVGTNGTIYSGTSGAVSTSNSDGANGIYTVNWDRDVTYCSPTVDPYQGNGIYATASNFDVKTTTIYLWRLDGTTHNVKPVTVGNDYFYLIETC